MLSRVSRRSYATASSSFKLAVKEFESPVSKLQVVVKNAGSKSDEKSGLSHLLSNFNFLNTSSKSGLRLKRESELLGGSYKSFVTRDDLILEAQFLKEDLPYYLNALGSTLSELAFKPHEFSELVLPTSLHQFQLVANDSKFQLVEKLHALTFKKGLGNPLYFDGVSKVTLDDLKSFSSKYYTKQNVEIKGFGVVEKDLANFLDTSSFSLLPEGSASSSVAAKSFGGAESRLRIPSLKTTAAIGAAVPKGEEATFAALVALINSKFPTSLAVEINSTVASYDSASFFYVTASSLDASLLSASIKSIAKELKSAKGLSKLSGAVEFESAGKLDTKSIKDTFELKNFNYAVAGNTDGIPFIDEL